MAEYIEREALIAAYDKAHKGPPGGARKLMEEAPAVDVVAVVRCEYCTCWKKTFVNSKGFRICPASGMDITEDDFCSYGERRDSDG